MSIFHKLAPSSKALHNLVFYREKIYNIMDNGVIYAEALMREIYLDNSATTKVYTEAAQKAVYAMCEEYGNPSSLHSFGIRSEKLLTEARENIGKALNANAGEIYFTSGGTEANNLALIGGAVAKRRKGEHIIISLYEHDSIMAAAAYLENEGFHITRLAPNGEGIITPEMVKTAMTDKTTLVSVMYVNNETGAINPVEEIAKAVKKANPNTLFHTDAVQAFGKLPISLNNTAIDLMSITAHKIGGPKGVGALWIKKGVRIAPRALGGAQEKKMRGGTEAVPLIVAFGEAVKITLAEQKSMAEKYIMLYDTLKSEIDSTEGLEINSPQNGLPAILNFSVLGIRSEIMLHYLEERGIYVSSGSACAMGAPSHVLDALGLDKKRADSAIRVSFGRENTKEDILFFIEAVRTAKKELCR